MQTRSRTRSEVSEQGDGAAASVNPTFGGDDAADDAVGVTLTYRHTVRKTWGPVGVRIDHPTRPLRLALLPDPFMRRCGDETWSFVFKVLDLTTPATRNGGTVYAEDGTAYLRSTSEVPRAGTYVLRMPDDADVQISKGPTNNRGKQLGAPTLDVSESTVSDSGRSTIRQTTFKTALSIRDHGTCLLSGEWHESCIGAHIAPISRPDVYQAIYGSDYREMMFEPSSGLLLRADLHRAYDRFEWSFYCADDGSLYVHIFYASSDSYMQYHGKRLDPATRFAVRASSADTGYPDRRLLQWHYKQCVQARVRGYAYDMAVNAQGGSIGA